MIWKLEQEQCEVCLPFLTSAPSSSLHKSSSVAAVFFLNWKTKLICSHQTETKRLKASQKSVCVCIFVRIQAFQLSPVWQRQTVCRAAAPGGRVDTVVWKQRARPGLSFAVCSQDKAAPTRSTCRKSAFGSCLTAVDSREARVISRFPLSPSRAGTRMKISVMYWKAPQCCWWHEELESDVGYQSAHMLLSPAWEKATLISS